MKLQIKILDTVLKRLYKIDKSCFGNLYGIFSANTVIVLGLQVELEKKLNQSYSFPAELDFCGIFQAHANTVNEKAIVNKAENIIYEVITDNPLFINIKLGAKNEVDTNIIHNSKIENISYTTTTEQEVYSQFTHLHLKGYLPLRSELAVESLTETFQNLRHKAACGVIAFTVPNKSIFLLGKEGESSIVGVNGDPTIAELYEESNGATEYGNKKKKSSNFELEIVDVGMVRKITKDTTSEEGKSKGHAPVVILDKKHLTVVNTTISIDFLAIINRSLKFSKAYDILIETVMKNLRLLESVLLEKIQTSEDFTLSAPETFHFYPREAGHFISKVYFKKDQEQDLRLQRELLHRQLLVDMDAPQFRRANQYIFRNSLKKNGPLINPHVGVRMTENGGHVALVKGKYEYYHYSQDKMDDNGWGCAYRSLQTLSSWFILQGYLRPDAHVPTFQEIQKCLVDIGDKPSNFIGSKQWIGSTEVNFVLETLFGITSRILHVSSGEEMSSKGPELVNHFELHGSPVMIGGGVLAHTILGVDYNQQTGTIKFLILDPHYTGSEDLHTIQSKGWCGWKNVDFWTKSAYYNMCLPQVPREI